MFEELNQELSQVKQSLRERRKSQNTLADMNQGLQEERRRLSSLRRILQKEGKDAISQKSL